MSESPSLTNREGETAEQHKQRGWFGHRDDPQRATRSRCDERLSISVSERVELDVKRACSDAKRVEQKDDKRKRWRLKVLKERATAHDARSKAFFEQRDFEDLSAVGR